jgi:hypothetical protein
MTTTLIHVLHVEKKHRERDKEFFGREKFHVSFFWKKDTSIRNNKIIILYKVRIVSYVHEYYF